MLGKEKTMTLPVAIRDVFADAQAVHAQAIERLAQGDIRDAAEKAWCATLRATDALILARTGEEPNTSPDTGTGLDRLARENPRITTLVGRYYSRQSTLHGGCFYKGLLSDVPTIERRIRETDRYILDAMGLADPL
jgi:hypothetical protein